MTPTGPELAIAERIAKAREPLLIRGAGTKSGMLRPVQAATTISTAGLTGITLYRPKELILSALAGTPVVKIEETLDDHGQHLIAEPPDLSALFGTEPGTQTIGGIVATNLSGPRRVAWGAMRDHVMGIRAVNGSGEVIHSGGRVLKNVTGLDLCKLLSGSHGTLAVITEVTLKVLPAPETTGTVVIVGLDAERGVAALSAGLGSPYGVSAAAWLPDATVLPGLRLTGSATLLRIEDFAASVAYRMDRLRTDLTSFGQGEIVEDAVSRAIWRVVRDAHPLQAHPDEAVWRVSVRPSAGPPTLRAAIDAGSHGFLDWGGGLVWLAGAADIATHEAMAAIARAAHGTWTLLRAPEALRAAVQVVPPEAEALARITRRVKAAFDPRGILNPGRFVAGL
ncbi:MAG TPA: FAD-binding protein [Acetobacteraceae bacterium]|jgi:glycolate oxidase FAD binding subunit|nr:FAD-binding protein [Acetobacteraceae bacterium]